MISQLRTYTVNRGMMDQWVKLFAEKLVPMQEKHGIKVDGMWVNADRNQFIWIRSFADAADLEAKEAAFYGAAEWQAAVDHTRSHLAKVVVQAMSPALDDASRGLIGPTEALAQLRIYTVNRGMMEPWVKLFTQQLIGIQENQGISIDATWVTDDDSQFVWIRSFAGPEDVKAKEAAFNDSAEWKAIVDHARSHLARLDVHTMEPVLQAASAPAA